MIVAQIGVGEHIVADRLAGAQPAAMADHQPRLGAQHREMVADRLGVGRADADVDQRHPRAVRPDQMIGGHLDLAPIAVGDRAFGIGGLARHQHPARDRQRLVRAVGFGEFGQRPGDELVDVADIVGEQDVGPEILRRRPRIMLEPRQREIDARTLEQRQRPRRVLGKGEQPVGDLVADVGQPHAREDAREFGRLHAVERQFVGAVEHVGIGDLLSRPADRDAHPVVAHQQAQLVLEIAAEQARAGDAGRIAARLVEPREGAREARDRALGLVIDAQLGIGEQPGARAAGSGSVRSAR